MAEVTALMVKELREKTGAGMMDCKKALLAKEGDMEEAISYLREKGLAAAAKKAGRIAAEGLVESSVVDSVGVLVEVNCETDFVAKTDDFREFTKDVAMHILTRNPKDVSQGEGNEDPSEYLLTQQYGKDETKTVEQVVSEKIAKIGENIAIRRFARYAPEKGLVEAYIHMGGRIGVLVEAHCENGEVAKASETHEFVRDIAMHIAAARPEFVSRSEVPSELVEKEKAIIRAAALNEGKQEQFLGKIVEGRIDKFYKDICLLEQNYVKDPDKTVEQVVKEKAELLGDTLVIARFTRFERGEGIEKRQEDFAAEVMAQIKQ